MADFVAVLRKTLDGLGETTPEMRERVYDKARATVSAKLAAISPPPPPAVSERQTKALEEAIATVESEYAPAAPAFEDPLEELESVFAALKEGKPIAPVKPVAKPQPSLAVPRAATLEEPPAAAAREVEIEPADQLFDTSSEPSVEPSPHDRQGDFSFEDRSSSEDEVPPARMGLAPVADDDVTFSDDDRRYDRRYDEDAAPSARKRSYRPAIAAGVALLLLGGAGYGVWANKDDLSAMLGLNGTSPAQTPPPAEQPASQPAAETDVAAAPPAAEPAQSEATQQQPEGEPKFTQRLNADGSEVDAGPSGGEQTFGEGTSVAALTTPVASDQPPAVPPGGDSDETAAAQPDTDPLPAAPMEGTPPTEGTAPPEGLAPTTGTTPPAAETSPSQLAVGQRAIFYEERTSAAQGSAEPGTIVWSEVQESPGGDMPPEPAIRAEATIPGKDIQLRMTIRRNGDKTLPASHIIEMIFLTPDNFEGGGIDNVLRVALKSSEQDAGSPLLGIPAKIADGFFLVALNDSKNEMDTNLGLLKRQSWIDIPIVYKNGRRALFTMEKGVPGDKVFDATLKAWEPKTAG